MLQLFITELPKKVTENYQKGDIYLVDLVDNIPTAQQMLRELSHLIIIAKELKIFLLEC